MYIDDVAQKYSVAEARTNLPAIIDQAQAGLSVELTRRGTPVAVVVSVRDFQRLQNDRPEFREAYKRFLKTHVLEHVGLEANVAVFARQKGVGRGVIL